MNKNYTLIHPKNSVVKSVFSLNTVLAFLFVLFGISSSFGQVAQRGTATSATNSAVTTLITINKPTGVVNGDIMIVNITQRGNAALSDPTCTGWTPISGVNLGGATNRRVSVLYKIAVGAEPANYTFTLDADVDFSAGAIIAFSGVDTTTPFDVGPGTLNIANSVTVTGTGLTTVTNNAAIIMLGGSAGATWSGWTTTSPGGLTELYDIQNTISIGAAWAIKGAAGATGNGTATLANSQRNGGVLLALRAYVAPPTITSFTPSSACASSSQTVVITGTNFTGASAVTIGGTAAAYVVNSATQITATIGTGTTGVIRVTTAGGIAISATNFTVNPLPAAIAGGAATVCTGASTVPFTNATGGGTWSISNTNATINASGIVTGITAGAVNVIYTLPTGCSITRAITVQQTPGAIAGGAATVCRSSSTPAFTNPNGGGTWTVTSGTGTATITSPGGVLTGTGVGTVTVNYTIGSCTPATYAVTVNPTPVITTQPVATSICTTGSGTFNVVATGATTYQWRRAGVALTNTAPYSGVNTPTLTITNPTVGDAGNFTVDVGNGTCSVTSTARALTVTTTQTITTNPVNRSIGVGTNTTFTAAGNNTPTSYTWQVSTDGGGTWTTVTNGGVYSTTATATLNITAATIGMNGYLYRASATNACGTSAYSTNATLTVTYCTPTSTNTSDYISGFSTTGGVTNINNPSGGLSGTGYGNFYAVHSASQYAGSSLNFTETYNTGNHGLSIWVDLNNNEIFEATERLYNATATAAGFNGSITIPGGTTAGDYRMRVRAWWNNLNPDPCTNIAWGEAEDYKLTVLALSPCVAPTAQPSLLALTPGGTTINGTFTAASPAPNNYLVVANTTAIAPTITNGTTYTIGQDLGSTNVVVDTDSNTAFSATSLAANTTYYFFVYSMNNLCTGGPSYNTAGPLIGNATTPISYCPSVPNSNFPDGILNVEFNTINNTTTSLAAVPYTDYTALNTTVTQGQTHNINVRVNTDGNFTMAQMVWFDWNQDGDFNDAGEAYNLGTVTNNANGLSSSCPLPILIPVTASLGTTRMRVSSRFNVPGSPCENGQDGEVEDYSVTILAAPPCTSPTTQPTVLVLTPGATSIAGSFTAAPAPTPQNYLVVMNATGTAPTGLIANGTTYTIGSSIGVGNTVIDTDGNTTFTAAGLNTTSTYYFYIYSMNALCSGGPLYNTNPTVLIGNATTTGTPTAPCIPTTVATRNADKYISRVAFIGTMVETNNTSAFNNATPGYEDFTGLPLKAVQAQGEGVNMIVESLGGRARLIAWVDWNKNGAFETSEIVYGPPTAGISSTFGFVIPTGTVPGDYRVRVRTFNSFYNDGNAANGNPDEYFGLNYTACEPFNTGTIGGFPTNQYGEAEDYLFTVIQRCDANIVSVTDGQVCNSGTVVLGATGTAGTTHYRWYAVASGGSQLPGSPTTGSWTTPSISTTTTYYVNAWNGTCESLERKPVVANVNTTPTLTFTPSSPETCGENNIISITATGDKELSTLLFENFEGGGLGAFTNVNSDASPGAVKNDTRWTNRASTFIPLVGVSWKPAISSGLAPNSFALATSDSGTRPETLVENSLLSGVLNSTNYLNLTMTMKFYYSRYFPDGNTPADEFVSIQISQDGGGIWTTLETFTADTGIGTKFANLSYNLNAYINQTNLRVRILHHSLGSTDGWLPDGVAVDDVKIFGEIPLGTSFNWTSVLPVDAYSNAACTIPYVSGTPAVMVYIKPTLDQLELTSYSFTASALLSNGCSASSLITINNKSKIWKGGTNSDWNTASNWLPVGVPDATNCVIIPPVTNSSLVGGANYNGFGKTLQVIDGGNLKINPTNTLTITDFVEVRGTGVFDIEDSGSLVQINNVANTGNITYKRIAPGIRGFDYVYWSSPVSNQAMETIYSSPVSGPKYLWNTTVPNTNAGLGNWETASGVMQRAKGYIIRGSSSYGMPATNIAASFTGVPHNGNIPFTIARGSYTGGDYNGTNGTQITNLNDNYNLIGNPYPSAIDAKAFLTLNTYDLGTNPTGQIHGNVKLWRHGNAPAAIVNPFYGSFTYNYTANDYVTVNLLGASDPVSTSEIIKTGQAFLVQMIDGPASTAVVNFNNSMRLNTGFPHNNGSFFRTTSTIDETTIASETSEKHRIWLDIIDQNNTVSGTLIGYATGASDAFDTFNDARSAVPNFMKIYSLLDNEVYDIQGKSVPFNNNDQVPLGITIVQAGNYKIGLNTIDGLFLDTTQNIYLEDKTTNIIHNLKTSPYSFTSTVGTFHERFVLRYTNETLSVDDFTANDIKVYANESINVIATNQTIKSVRVYDLLGRVLGSYTKINESTFSTTKIAKTQTVLIVEVVLENGAKESYKVIF